MKPNLKVFLWILGTILAAGMVQYAISAADPAMPWRVVVAHVVGAIGTSLGALLIKLPKREWSEEERDEKLGDKA